MFALSPRLFYPYNLDMNFEFLRSISPRAFLGALVIAVVLLFLTFSWIIWTAPPAPVPGNIVAVQTIIPAPTGTLVFFPTETQIPQTPTINPGQIFIGAYVQISGTGGDGLRIRSTPGLNGKQLFLGYDSELFIVQDGPRELDGYVWWYLVAPYDQTRAGWAASNYLSVVPAPTP